MQYKDDLKREALLTTLEKQRNLFFDDVQKKLQTKKPIIDTANSTYINEMKATLQELCALTKTNAHTQKWIESKMTELHGYDFSASPEKLLEHHLGHFQTLHQFFKRQ
jgi:uncharacterized protein involved in tolerance to divalent cations